MEMNNDIVYNGERQRTNGSAVMPIPKLKKNAICMPRDFAEKAATRCTTAGLVHTSDRTAFQWRNKTHILKL
jgi:hypothetical protein